MSGCGVINTCLLESRKRCAQYFFGDDKLRLTFDYHSCHVWVDLTYDEESEFAMVHNIQGHDVNVTTYMDKVFKARTSWIQMGSFEWLGSNDSEVKKLKNKVYCSIGMADQKEQANNALVLRIACMPEEFFDKISAVNNLFRNAQLKGMKPAKSGEGGSASARKRLKTDGKEASANYGRENKDSEIHKKFFKELGWIKLQSDFSAVGNMLERLVSNLTTLDEFMKDLAQYKDMKFLRIQLRVLVST